MGLWQQDFACVTKWTVGHVGLSVSFNDSLSFVFPAWIIITFNQAQTCIICHVVCSKRIQVCFQCSERDVLISGLALSISQFWPVPIQATCTCWMDYFKAHSLEVNPLVFGGVYMFLPILIFWMVDGWSPCLWRRTWNFLNIKLSGLTHVHQTQLQYET